MQEAELSISAPDFTAEVSHGDPRVLRLAGSADGTVKQALEALVAQLHAALVAAAATAVTVDLRALQFMSAAAFNALVGWLALADELPAERRYRIGFRSNPSILWQRRSLHALACFATDIVAIDEDA